MPWWKADIGRLKRVIGHALRSQTDKRQATEVAIAVDVLNRLLELGTPDVRSHCVRPRRPAITAPVFMSYAGGMARYPAIWHRHCRKRL
jgi:hypothetical protein